MQIFPFNDSNYPASLWIAARYFQAFSILGAIFFRKRSISQGLIVFFSGIVFLLINLSIFWWKIFPVCYVEGVGLTAFKKISEFLIIGLFLASIILIIKNKTEFNRTISQGFIKFLIIMIVGELFFTLYTDVFGLFNLLGHYSKFLAYYFLYEAFVGKFLQSPFTLVIHNLKLREMELQREIDTKERKTQEIFELLRDFYLYA